MQQLSLKPQPSSEQHLPQLSSAHRQQRREQMMPRDSRCSFRMTRDDDGVWASSTWLPVNCHSASTHTTRSTCSSSHWTPDHNATGNIEVTTFITEESRRFKAMMTIITGQEYHWSSLQLWSQQLLYIQCTDLTSRMGKTGDWLVCTVNLQSRLLRFEGYRRSGGK